MYDISGSAHFINKCDNGIVIHRNRNPEAGPVDQVQVGFIYEVYFINLLLVIYLFVLGKRTKTWLAIFQGSGMETYS